MNFHEIAWQIADLLETSRAIYLRTEPEVPDFTIGAPFKCSIWNLRQKVELEISPNNITTVMGLFDATIFNKEHVDRLYVWNIKTLSAYVHAFIPKFVSPTTSVIDLRVIENFLGIRKTRPENLVEAINRTKVAVQYKGWQKLYKSIHLPLALRVLPSIETTPLLNEETRKSEYPYYEIEGQANGRMNCLKKYSSSYLPHNLGPEARKNLKPRGYGLRFVSADFRHCEVTVLQWLTGDEALKQILDSGRDLHERIYEVVTEDKCDTEKKRTISKMLFLPVMYGCGPQTLATNLGLREAVGVELHNRIRTRFHTCYDRMLEIQKKAETGPVEDYFGRQRTFPEGEFYKARNFWVQGVAATACQEKLIDLHKAFDGENAFIAYSVHDGYCGVCTIRAARNTYRTMKQTLEAESVLCPGLRMKVEIKFGARLDEMKVLWRD
jgi:hypothetical protein